MRRDTVDISHSDMIIWFKDSWVFRTWWSSGKIIMGAELNCPKTSSNWVVFISSHPFSTQHFSLPIFNTPQPLIIWVNLPFLQLETSDLLVQLCWPFFIVICLTKNYTRREGLNGRKWGWMIWKREMRQQKTGSDEEILLLTSREALLSLVLTDWMEECCFCWWWFGS